MEPSLTRQLTALAHQLSISPERSISLLSLPEGDDTLPSLAQARRYHQLADVIFAHRPEERVKSLLRLAEAALQAQQNAVCNSKTPLNWDTAAAPLLCLSCESINSFALFRCGLLRLFSC